MGHPSGLSVGGTVLRGKGGAASTGSEGAWLTGPLTAQLVFDVVRLPGKELEKLIFVLFHDTLTLSGKGEPADTGRRRGLITQPQLAWLHNICSPG